MSSAASIWREVSGAAREGSYRLEVDLKVRFTARVPYRSASQRRFMYAAEARGDVPKGTAGEWEKHTPKDKPLPEKVSKKNRLKAWAKKGKS